MNAHIIRADSRHLPMADNTVDLVVTSPPYFALRSYQDGGAHYAGQIGDEPTPAEFVDALLEVTRECVRVLKPSGSLWVNLGDKYAGGGGGGDGSSDGETGRASRPARREYAGLRAKSLMGIPWRYALRCIDDLGLILRAEVIWSKPNGLPESVTDRVRRSHEQWFHFTLSPRYYSAVDEIREAHSENSHARRKDGAVTPKGAAGLEAGVRRGYMGETYTNPLGKLPGSVWTIPTEPLQVPDHLGIDHFAAFPSEFPRRIIQGWSPAGVCVECGEGRRPVATGGGLTEEGRALLARRGVHANQTYMARSGRNDAGWGLSHNISGTERARLAAGYTITGYACACPEPTAPTTPGVVLDPFGGTGTTALVAKALGRHGITVDMSADYCRLAQWRTNDPKQLAKAARREFRAPVEVPDGQESFDFGEAS